MVFALFVDVADEIDIFLNFVPSLHCGDDSHLIMLYDPLDVVYWF